MKNRTNPLLGNKLKISFPMLFIGLFLVTSFLVTNSSGQSTPTLQTDLMNNFKLSEAFEKNPPVHIEAIYLKEEKADFRKDITLERPIDLFSQLAITIVNRSEEQISGIVLEIRMPIIGGEIDELVIPFNMLQNGDCSKPLSGQTLAPKAQVTTSTSEMMVKSIEPSLRKLGYRLTNGTITIGIEVVKFANGRAWRNGFLLERNRDKPGVWEPVNFGSNRVITMPSNLSLSIDRSTTQNQSTPKCWSYTGYQDAIPCEWVINDVCPEGPYSCETTRDSATCCTETGGVSPRTVLKSCRCIYSFASCEVFPITEYSGPCP